ncbi:MAG: GTP cyclohydrolase II, partial [Mameliella sp.]|nr:GTP cyclohydrolase II [Phaeodactylibacter sp.]
QYNIAIEMLQEIGIEKINLLTNNPEKIHAFDDTDIELVSRVPLIIEPQKENFGYLKTKQDEMGHLFKL